MLVLFETSGGFAIFKLLKEKKLVKAENLYKEFKSPDKGSKLIALRNFIKFDDMEDALASASATIKGKMSEKLKKILKQISVEEAQEELAVSDPKLGKCITSKLNIICVSNSDIQELMRCIRMHLDSLLEGLPQKELAAMSLGVAHGLQTRWHLDSLLEGLPQKEIAVMSLRVAHGLHTRWSSAWIRNSTTTS